MKYNALFEYVIRTSGENTDDIDDFDDRDNFWAPVPENLLFEWILREASAKMADNIGAKYVYNLYSQALTSKKNNRKTNGDLVFYSIRDKFLPAFQRLDLSGFNENIDNELNDEQRKNIRNIFIENFIAEFQNYSINDIQVSENTLRNFLAYILTKNQISYDGETYENAVNPNYEWTLNSSTSSSA